MQNAALENFSSAMAGPSTNIQRVIKTTSRVRDPSLDCTSSSLITTVPNQAVGSPSAAANYYKQPLNNGDYRAEETSLALSVCSSFSDSSLTSSSTSLPSSTRFRNQRRVVLHSKSGAYILARTLTSGRSLRKRLAARRRAKPCTSSSASSLLHAEESDNASNERCSFSETYSETPSNSASHSSPLLQKPSSFTTRADWQRFRHAAFCTPLNNGIDSVDLTDSDVGSDDGNDVNSGFLDELLLGRNWGELLMEKGQAFVDVLGVGTSRSPPLSQLKTYPLELIRDSTFVKKSASTIREIQESLAICLQRRNDKKPSVTERIQALLPEAGKNDESYVAVTRLSFTCSGAPPFPTWAIGEEPEGVSPRLCTFDVIPATVSQSRVGTDAGVCLCVDESSMAIPEIVILRYGDIKIICVVSGSGLYRKVLSDFIAINFTRRLLERLDDLRKSNELFRTQDTFPEAKSTANAPFVEAFMQMRTFVMNSALSGTLPRPPAVQCQREDPMGGRLFDGQGIRETAHQPRATGSSTNPSQWFKRMATSIITAAVSASSAAQPPFLFPENSPRTTSPSCVTLSPSESSTIEPQNKRLELSAKSSVIDKESSTSPKLSDQSLRCRSVASVGLCSKMTDEVSTAFSRIGLQKHATPSLAPGVAASAFPWEPDTRHLTSMGSPRLLDPTLPIDKTNVMLKHASTPLFNSLGVRPTASPCRPCHASEELANPLTVGPGSPHHFKQSDNTEPLDDLDSGEMEIEDLSIPVLKLHTLSNDRGQRFSKSKKDVGLSTRSPRDISRCHEMRQFSNPQSDTLEACPRTYDSLPYNMDMEGPGGSDKDTNRAFPFPQLAFHDTESPFGLKQFLSFTPDLIESTLLSSLNTVSNDLRRRFPTCCRLSGVTLSAAVSQSSTGLLGIANIGDIRVVLAEEISGTVVKRGSRWNLGPHRPYAANRNQRVTRVTERPGFRAIVLSGDHSVRNRTERRRLEAAGASALMVFEGKGTLNLSPRKKQCHFGSQGVDIPRENLGQSRISGPLMRLKTGGTTHPRNTVKKSTTRSMKANMPSIHGDPRTKLLKRRKRSKLAQSTMAVDAQDFCYGEPTSVFPTSPPTDLKFTRALGYTDLQCYGLSPVADLADVKLRRGRYNFIVIATHCVWMTYSSVQAVIDFIADELFFYGANCEHAARLLWEDVLFFWSLTRSDIPNGGGIVVVPLTLTLDPPCSA